MLLSIIIPTYNSAHLIQECIESLIDKLDKDCCEIIVVDGFSNDNTIEILNNFINKYKQIRYISERDKGIYDAMNKGIHLAKGDFIYFIGADDRFMSNCNELRIYLKNKDIIYYGNVLMGNLDYVYDGEFNSNKIIQKNICHQSIFYPTNILRTNLYNLKYKLLSDYELNLRLWKKYKFKHIPLNIAYYSNDGLSTKIKDNIFKKDFIYLIYKYLGIFYVLKKIQLTIIKRIISK